MGTEEMEAVILVDVLRRAGADVLMASVETDLVVEASSGTKLVADVGIDACADEVFDLVALPVSLMSVSYGFLIIRLFETGTRVVVPIFISSKLLTQ